MFVPLMPAPYTAWGDHSYLEKAKQYDFGKDLGAKYAVSQVWKLTKQDYKYYIIGVGFTMLGALDGVDARMEKERWWPHERHKFM